jgi:hypothetical protein
MNDNVGPFAVIAVIVMLVAGLLAGMFVSPSMSNSIGIDAKAHGYPFNGVINFTETGLPTGTTWSGTTIVSGGSYNTFSTTATYYDAPVGSGSSYINGSFNLNPVLTGSNHYYAPHPQDQAFNFLYSKVLNVSVSFTEITGYLVNVTTYSLPFDTIMSGYFYTNLYPANTTYYFSTHANTISTVLPNGTWFIHMNDSYYNLTDTVYTSHYKPLIANSSFVIDGVNYTIIEQFIDVTPNQEFTIHFLEQGLKTGTQWEFTINGSTHYTNISAMPGVILTLTPDYYNISASAVGYTYVGPANIYIGVNGMTVYLNFTNNSKTGTVNQLAGIFAGAGVSLTGFYSSVTLLVALGATIGTYYKFEDLVVSAALFVTIPWIVYGLGVASGQHFVQIWVPLWMLLFAVAGVVFTAVIRGHYGSAE